MKYLKLILPLIFLLLLSNCSVNKFSLKEKRIIKKIKPNNEMSLMLLNNPKDSIILYNKSKNIKLGFRNRKLKKLIKGMYSTVRSSTNPGVGIAAPQVGVNKRIVWVQRFDKTNEPFEFYLNSRIIYYSKKKSEGSEGCLSIPEFTGEVFRSDTIVMKYDLLKSKNLIDTVSGFTAIIFQHEIDHLNGILYIDRIKDKSKIKKRKK